MNMMPSSTSSRYQTAKGTKSTFRYLIPSLLTSRSRRTSRLNDQRSRWPWSAQQTRSSCNRVLEQQQMYHRLWHSRSSAGESSPTPHFSPGGGDPIAAIAALTRAALAPRPCSFPVHVRLRFPIFSPRYTSSPPPPVLQVVGASEGPTGLAIFGTVSSGRRVRVSFQRMTLLRRCTTVVRAAMSG